MEIIQIDETTRIRHMDAKNWTVETYRDCKAKDGTKRKDWRQAQGEGRGPFYAKPEGCMEWLLRNRFAGEPGAADLALAIRQFDAIARWLHDRVEEAMSR